jgi:hypothetical protein
MDGVLRTKKEPERPKVQIFVHARDGKWYPQAEPLSHAHGRKNFHWKAQIVIGDFVSPEGTPYEIVAMAGHEKVTEPVIDVLPEAPYKSSIFITVRG